MNKSLPTKSNSPMQAKAVRRRTATASADQEQIAAAIAPLQSRWSANAQLRPVTAASMRGIRAKAARLGLSPDEIAARGGAAIADVVRAIADARDASGKLPIFFLAGSDRDAAYGLEAALALANGQRRLVIALFGTRARPEHSSAAGVWDRLESAPRVERYRIPNMREAAHFRAGIEEVAVLVDALGGAPTSTAPQVPLLAAIDLIRRARSVGVPCVAVGGPIGLDPESGARRRGTPGADVSVLFHRPLTTHQSLAAQKLLGEVLVAPIGIPDEADALAV